MGIDAEALRGEIAQSVIKKRLSEATAQEIARVLDHITGLHNPPHSPLGKGGSFKNAKGGRYDSSRAGLIEELEDAARARWGAEFEGPLNAFVNSHLKIKTNYRWLRVSALKALKTRIVEMSRHDGMDKGA